MIRFVYLIFVSISEITFQALTHSSAPLTSRSISILCRHVSMTVCTRRQLSRLTVC